MEDGQTPIWIEALPKQLILNAQADNKGAAHAVPAGWFDPRRGDAAFTLEPLPAMPGSFQTATTNYFTAFWIQKGGGTLEVELAEYRFQGPVLLFLSPYQTCRFCPATPLTGHALKFHANFFCIETYHDAVGCNGVLFNDVFGSPCVTVPRPQIAEFNRITSEMAQELQTTGLAQSELLVSYLKVFLIKATRLKLAQAQAQAPSGSAAMPVVLDRLIELIEQHYRTTHAPAQYAAWLNLTPKALGKLAKAHFARTITQLIRDRLLRHAKWQLLHTRRPVKEIAAEVGFADELYFSRVFKRAAGCSPTDFREFETAIRGGRNLSM